MFKKGKKLVVGSLCIGLILSSASTFSIGFAKEKIGKVNELILNNEVLQLNKNLTLDKPNSKELIEQKIVPNQGDKTEFKGEKKLIVGGVLGASSNVSICRWLVIIIVGIYEKKEPSALLTII